MNFRLLCISKTTDSNILALFKEYEQRLKHYIKFNVEYFELKKKSSSIQNLKEEEGILLLNSIAKNSILVLLDEGGKSFTSVKFSSFLQKRMNSGAKEIVFIIGGAFGFSDELYQRSNFKIALSEMTFTHQMVRLVFIEQLYRGLTILRGEKYHH